MTHFNDARHHLAVKLRKCVPLYVLKQHVTRFPLEYAMIFFFFLFLKTNFCNLFSWLLGI